MEMMKAKILGSNYVGLFGVCNDELCILPAQIDKKTEERIIQTLGVKIIKMNIYGSALIAAFVKMNNKYLFVPRFVDTKEIEQLEKEIKVKVLDTDGALGNLIELNDTGAIVSKALDKKAVEELKKSGLAIEQMNLSKTEVTGSAIVATNSGFLVNPNITKEEAKKIEETLGVKGGAATANTGDYFVRNSVLANKKGILVGEGTTPFEMNKIEEALEEK